MKKKSRKILYSLVVAMVMLIAIPFVANSNSNETQFGAIEVQAASTSLETVSGLEVSISSSLWLQLSWEAVPSATYYQVYQEVNGSIKLVSTVYSGLTYYIVENLTSSSSYVFAVQAFAKIDGVTYSSDLSESITAYTGPGQVVAGSTTSTTESVGINWNAVNNADGYEVYLYSEDKTEFVADLGADTLTYSLSGLTFGTTYEFKVRAYVLNDGKRIYGAFSDTIYASTSNLNVELLSNYTRTSDAIRVNWESVNGVSGYRVYVYQGTDYATHYTLYGDDIVTCRISGLEIFTEYSIQIRAFYKPDSDTTYWGKLSDVIYASTYTMNVDELTSYSATAQTVTVNWDSLKMVSGFRIYTYSNGKLLKYNTIYGDDLTSYCITDLDILSQYEVKIRAFYKTDSTTQWGDYSELLSVETSGPDTVSVSSSYSATSDAIRINWTSLSYAAGYRVYIYDGDTYIKHVTIYGADNDTYRFGDLDFDSSYNFYVRAFYKVGSTTYWSDYSKVFTAKTDGPEKVNVSSAYTATVSSIKINWTSLSDSSGYRVYVYDGDEYIKHYTIYGSSYKTYTISNLDMDTEYVFYVRAFYKIGTSTYWGDYSSMVRATTENLAKGVMSTSITNTLTSITVKWNAIDGADGYRLYIGQNGKFTTLTTTTSSKTVTFKATSLTSATQYDFKVRAYQLDSSGNYVWGESSDIIEAYTSIDSTNIYQSYYTGSSIEILWDKVSGADGYRVYITVGSKTSTKTLYGASSTSYTLTGLDYATECSFEVRAFFKTDTKTIWSDYSSTHTTSTYTKAVEVKSTYLATYSSITIYWYPTSGAEAYAVYFKEGSGDWVYMGLTATANVTSYSYKVYNLSPDTTFSFKVIPVIYSGGNVIYGYSTSGTVETLSY